MIPCLSIISAPTTGFVEKPPELVPSPITDIRVDGDRIVWTYDEPSDFTGYLVKTTLVAGRSWAASTLLTSTAISSTFVLRSALPANTKEVLVKPTRFGFEAIREARVAVPTDPDDPEPPGPPGTSATFPGGPWIRVAPYASRTSKQIAGTASALQTKINSASPGDTLVLNANSSNGTLTVSCKGTQANPIIICTDTDLGDEANYRQLTGGKVIFNGAQWVIFRGFKTAGVRFEYQSLSHCQVECNRFSGVSSGGDAYSGMLHLVTGENVTDLLIGFNHYVGDTTDSSSFFDIEQAIRPKRFLITHNFTDGMKGAGKIYQPGRNPGDGQHNLECVFQYHLDKDRNSTEDLFENKFNGTHFRHCTFHMAQTSGGGAQQTKVRHGRIDPGSTSIENGRGHLFEGLLYIQDGRGAAPSITIRGIHHKVINCWVLKLGATERPSLSSTPGNGTIEMFVGNRDPYQFPAICCLPKGKTICRYVGAAKCLAAGNRYFTVRSVDSEGGDDAGVCGEDYKPQGYPADRCWIPTGSSEKSRNGGFNSSGFTNTVTSAWPNSTAWPDADIDKVPLRLFPEDVGPNAWDSTFVLDSDGGGGGTAYTLAIGSDYTANYGANVSTGASLTQGVDSVRLTGGAQADHPAGVRMYSRKLITKPCRIRVVYTRKAIPSSTDANGVFSFIGLCLPNSSAPRPRPADFPAGTATGDDTLENWFTGFRLTLGNTNTVGTAQSDRFRCSVYVSGPRVQLTPTSPLIEINMGLNVAQELELALSGDTVTLTAIGLGLSQTYRDARIGAFTEGYLFFHGSSGSDSVWSNVRQIV